MLVLLIKGCLPQPKHFDILVEAEDLREHCDGDFVKFATFVADYKYEDPNKDRQETVNE